MTQRVSCSAALLLLVFTASCTRSVSPNDELGAEPAGIDPIGGGQSGGEGSTVCTPTEEPLESAKFAGTRVAELWDRFEAAMEARPLVQWWPKVRKREPLPRTRLELVSLSPTGLVKVGCGGFYLPTELHVRSEDAQLDATFAGALNGPDGGDLVQYFAELAEGGLAEGPARTGLAADATLLLELSWHAETESVSGTLSTPDASEPTGYIGPQVRGWEPTELDMRPALEISQLQQRVCAAQSVTSRATFASEDALRQSLAKRWVVCGGFARVEPGFAGFEIHADGRWHELRVEGDQLVAAQGYGHEGHIARNVFGDDYNLAILDWLPGGYEFARAALSADGNTLQVQAQLVDSELDATFQATDLPLRYPERKHERGARLGLAACEAPEADVTSRPASQSDLHAMLAGRWRFCSGGFGTEHAGVEFSADGREYHFLDASGARVASGALSIIDTSSQNGPGVFQIDVGLPNSVLILHPIFASAPVKMLARDDFQSLLAGW